MNAQRHGDWSQVASGRIAYPRDMRAEDVCLEDLDAPLARICRFNGHIRREIDIYSVAEHSVRVARLVHAQPNVRPQIVLAALLHDGGEAYSQDIIRPILRDPSMYEYKRQIMKPCQDAVFDWAGIDMRDRENTLIKWADNVLLATEKRDLLAPCDFEWSPLPEPLPERIEWMPMRAALAAFEHAFNVLVERCREAA